MIELTESALAAMRGALQQTGSPVLGLRIMVQTGGCAGFRYLMGFVESSEAEDVIIERDGVMVFVDPESRPRLQGTRIDFVETVEGSGFTFENPNVASHCACGKSFC